LKIDSKVKAVVDTGYLGIAWFYANSVIPVKRSEKRPLTRKIKRLTTGFQVNVF